MEKKLQVKDLTLSFRTQNGKVQAVRDISFDLYKGETLAIVGESGSGKSVTSKAIMGISAVNAIIENGEILYDGKDLTKIGEEQFYELRGNKIAMIFQDPMSSLNPIMRIGKQLTEAMLLKGKANQRESKKNFNTMLHYLEQNMINAIADQGAEKAKEVSAKVKNFDKFEYKHLELEGEYNEALDCATESAEEIKNILFEIEKNAVAPKAAAGRIKIILGFAKKAVSRYVVHSNASRYNELLAAVSAESKNVKVSKDFTQLSAQLKEMLEILEDAIAYVKPNFFAMGYYLTFSGAELPEMSVSELNVFLRKYLDDNFMLDFIAQAKKGIEYSYFNSVENKKQAIACIDEQFEVFNKEELVHSEVHAASKILIDAVEATIDRLAIKKDSYAYTFELAIKNAVKLYFTGIAKNDKEIKRHEREQAKYDKIIAKGKQPEWKVTPAKVIDLELAKKNICKLLTATKENFVNAVENMANCDFDAVTVEMIDYLKAQAAGVVNKVTQSMAKRRAIKLMEEVGIPEPRKRYRQYPFEFSGGMRQRIVIAIALAANPDILICDEPTTALDVTIQAQILELINKLKVERQLSVIFITHDLGVVANMADRIAVMYAGKIVEYGTSEDVFYSPAHPYTWALLASMPDLDTNEKLDAIPGTPPNMIYPPKGDAFAERNKYALEIDFEMQPPMFQISETHSAATWLLHPDAPVVHPPKIVTERIERMKERGGSSDG